MNPGKVIYIFVLLIPSVFCFSQNPVLDFHKISNTSGGFPAVLDATDYFGVGADSIGDLNGDGQVDIAVGAPKDDDGGTDRGAVYIIFLNSNGTVQSQQKISSTSGNFTGVLDDGDIFGSSVSSLGDLNNDGVSDLAVGAEYDGDGGYWHGAVWILFLNSDGTVLGHQKINEQEGGFTGTFNGGSPTFGSDIANIGDLNNDGNVDIAVGSRRDEDGGSRRGAVWILFLNNDGTVNSHQKISDTEGNFDAVLEFEDYFGGSVANIGDLNGDGIVDLAVSAYRDDDGGANRGAIYILFLNTDGTVDHWQKISDTVGVPAPGFLSNEGLFGVSVANIGDLDYDGNTDIVVGSPGDDTGGNEKGALFVLNLNSNGTVHTIQKIAEGVNGFTGTLQNNDWLGRSVASIGKVGILHNFLAGACFDDDGNTDAGAVWLFSIKGQPLESHVIENQENIRVFPNPGNGVFYLEINTPGQYSVTVYNVMGSMVLQEDHRENCMINIADKPDGIYYIKIRSENFSQNKTIVKCSD